MRSAGDHPHCQISPTKQTVLPASIQSFQAETHERLTKHAVNWALGFDGNLFQNQTNGFSVVVTLLDLDLGLVQ